MAHFYGVIKNSMNGKEVTKTGTRETGLVTICASKEGAVQCHAYYRDGRNMVRVQMIKWLGKGENRVLYDGPIGEYLSRPLA